MSRQYDFDTILLSIDWATHHWQDFDWTNTEEKIKSLRDETVHTIAQLHKRDKADEFSPIHLEQLRRFRLHSSPVPGTPQQQPIQEYFVDPTALMPRYAPRPPEPECTFKNKRFSSYTVSLELEVAIAAVAAIHNDRHAQRDPRTLLHDPMDRDKNDISLQYDLAQEIVQRIDSLAAHVVAVRRHPNENSPQYIGDVRKANEAARPQRPGAALEGSPSRVNLPPHMEHEAQRQLEATLDPDRTVLRDPFFSWERVESRAQEIRDMLVLKGNDKASARRIGDRYEDLLKQEWFAVKQDELHVQIPDMNPRWKAWCVEPLICHTTNNVIVPWHNVRREDYTPRPPGKDDIATPFPEEFYKFFYGKICSPVMPWGDWNWFVDQSARLEQVMYQLRQNFRIHRDMPSLGLGTVINVGYTKGFSLTQLKCILTLWLALESTIAKLNRRYMYETDVMGGRLGGAPLMCSSKLGMAALYALDPTRHNYQPYLHVFPRVEEKTYETLTHDQLHYYIPTKWLTNLSRAELLFVHAIWAETDITSLAAALEPPEGVRRPSLRLRCTGDNHTGAGDSGIDSKPQTIEFTGMQTAPDREHIMAWVAVCTEFVNAAMELEAHGAHKHFFENQDNVLEKLRVPDRHIDTLRRGFANTTGYYMPPDGPVCWDLPFFAQLPS